VKSLAVAKAALERKEFLGEVSEGMISLNPGKISGLQVFITE
jgi:tRNA-binding EMAP/Myf-like protein